MSAHYERVSREAISDQSSLSVLVWVLMSWSKRYHGNVSDGGRGALWKYTWGYKVQQQLHVYSL